MWGIGIDLVHIPTLAKIMQRNPAFKTATFTPEEIAYCEARGPRAWQHYAARFAAKEAYWKAMQLQELASSHAACTWTDIAVVITTDGAPRLQVPVVAAHVALVSLSHHGKYATAVVMLVPAGSNNTVVTTTDAEARCAKA